ncbi:MAG: flagellar motor switch protein FliN [Planctomycetaceae bacterium]|jgi:flagellar motor switch protein FliN/FliY|nr:flagellar motor switch protein FliN [Planctomycetaceae bacterium]
MGSDNVLDQNEIERLLGGGSGSSASPPSSPPPAAGQEAGVLNQSELDALFKAASSPPPPTDSASTGSSTSSSSSPSSLMGSSGTSTKPLDQSELDSLFGNATAATPSKPAIPSPTVPKPTATSPTSLPKQQQQATRPSAFAPPPAAMPEYRENAGAFNEPDTEEDEVNVPRGDIDYLLKRADDSLRSIAGTPMDLPTEVIEFQFPEFGGTVPSTEHATLDQISEVELDVKIELGRTNMYLEDVLKLRKGSVVPLDKMAGDAVDIFINGRLLARGEVLVMNENFCVRVAELLAGAIPME